MTNTKTIMARREKEIINEKIASYERAPSWFKHQELVEKWGVICDCDVCGNSVGEAPYGAE